MPRDCDEEHVECFRRCYNNTPPYPRKWHKESHYRYCQEEVCRPAYTKCVEEEKVKASDAKQLAVPPFEKEAEAQSWVKRQAMSVVGAVIFIGGTLYLIAESVGPVALLLAL